MLSKIWKWFLQGIALIAPTALTIAVMIWLGNWAERTVGGLVLRFLPVEYYFKGLGVIIGFFVILLIGLAANIFLVRWIVRTAERVLDRVPLVKTILQGIKDVARLFSSNADDKLGQVVAVDIADQRLIGFVMQQETDLPGELDDQSDRVAVYLPMSFMVGGYTLYVKREQVTPLDVPGDQAMRAVLTGGALKRASG